MRGRRLSGPSIMKHRRIQPRAVPADSREAQMVEEDEARRWQQLAPRLGFCGACGVSVDEDNPDPEKRRLHAHDCPYLPAERRKSA